MLLLEYYNTIINFHDISSLAIMAVNKTYDFQEEEDESLENIKKSRYIIKVVLYLPRKQLIQFAIKI